MPVLIILLYYIHDLSKLKRYYDQTEFVAHQMVNILQNIAYKRLQEKDTNNEHKYITARDVRDAFNLAWLSMYPGTTMYRNNSGHEFFHFPRIYIYYVKGDGDGKASVKWGMWVNTSNTAATAIGTPNFGNIDASSSTFSSVNKGTNVSPSSIYPTLRITGTDSKIILVVHIVWRSSEKNPKGKTISSAREAFKLFAVNPKFHGTSGNSYFQSVVIFTPNDGFPENSRPA